MHAVILAAGEGSRMGAHTDDVPKAFLDLAGRTLFDRQRTLLADYADETTVVLGYAYEKVLPDCADVRTVVLENWAEFENGESLRRALAGIDDDVLVLNGDVLVTAAALARVREHHARTDDRNVVACLDRVQEGATAIRTTDRGTVSDYGRIRGLRHAGLGIIERSHVDTARRVLERHRRDWYPHLYTAVETEVVRIPPSHHIEINYPRDVRAARGTLPLQAVDELDVGT